MDVVPTPAVSMEDVAGRIRKARVARDWTEIELAEHAGVSRPTVARVERGDDISTATLAKVAGALGLRVELRGNR
jgi:transcriptional regulator with XRE-family HTH domain